MSPLNTEQSRSQTRLRTWRRFKDKAARYGVAVGGISVIIAVMLIFFYLLVVVIPLFSGSHLEAHDELQVESGGKPLILAVEEQNEVALMVDDKGQAAFYHLKESNQASTVSQLAPVGTSVSSVARGNLQHGWYAFGLDNGTVQIWQTRYNVSYPDGKRKITPSIDFPFGDEPLLLDQDEQSLIHLAFTIEEGLGRIAAVTEDGRLLIASLEVSENMLTEELELETDVSIVESNIDSAAVVALRLSKDNRWLYIADKSASLAYWDVAAVQNPVLVQKVSLDEASEITAMEMLLGGNSVLIGDDTGRISQFFPVRDDANRYRIELIRQFDSLSSAVRFIEPEQRRKGFVAMDEAGNFSSYYSTASRVVMNQKLMDEAPAILALSPRSNGLYIINAENRLGQWHVENEHPEISWSALWGKVWYEHYQEPEFTWQSSAANNDFEPKFSLTPLAFGTLKGAFYAMLFAVPLALFGAIFTAHFMSQRMRQYVKPTIEIMEALPTVILGFLAGLWLAPYVEDNLVVIFTTLFLMPVAVLFFAFVWVHYSGRLRYLVPEGWEGALLVPVIIFVFWIFTLLGEPLQNLFFDGNMSRWLSESAGIGYDQRNAMVVGFAMGFAVIPTIFSIAEDAIFSVPKSLTGGSLALGATPWQTMVKVVLPTASPGIFSGLMIGLGRAVGETMIVLMATGNTPVMDFSVFEGMRTLSANIAVEMPESEVNSSHYRILFLAALVLFLFTFVVNTIAELVRQNLRKKYSSL